MGLYGRGKVKVAMDSTFICLDNAVKQLKRAKSSIGTLIADAQYFWEEFFKHPKGAQDQTDNSSASTNQKNHHTPKS